jgi:uncharacterized GH25 family protein
VIRFLFAVLLATPLLAHDFWIEPATFRPTPGTPVTIGLRVGEHFRGDPVVRRSARIESFVSVSGGVRQAVHGLEGSDPAGVVPFDDAGVVVIGYQGKATPHRMAPAKFAQYLREEGIEDLQPLPGREQREHFRRFAKSYVGVSASGRVPDALGFRLELQPVSDPFADAVLRVRLLFEGRPLAGALVVAMEREGTARTTARTDADGIASLDVGKGIWLLKSTHVRRVEAADHDWESLWASLTLQR